MQFEKTQELKQFLIDKKVFADFIDLQEICKGGSSYNYCVYTKSSKYFLKLTVKEKADLLDFSENNVFKHLYCLASFVFLEYYILIYPFVEGYSLSHHNCSLEFLHKLKDEYKKMQPLLIHKKIILPQQLAHKMVNNVDKTLQNKPGIFIKILNKIFWKKIKPQLLFLQPTNNIIHGDLTLNNIMMDKSDKPNILDIESVRYGYETEDICQWLLPLCGFKTCFGNLKKFKYLYSDINKFEHITADVWLYGVQMFYLNILIRRLNNPQKMKSFRKNVLWLICLINYFRFAKFLRQN